MGVSTLSINDVDAVSRVARFEPASVTAEPARGLIERRLEVRHQVHHVERAEAVLLAEDPALLRPSLARMALSALAAFVVMLTAGLVFAATAPRLLGYQSVVVVSGSMEPSIRVADVVLIAPSDGMGLGEGAVINFNRGDGATLHRIAQVTPDGYRTVGDANGSTDSDIVKPSEVLGVGVVVVPFVGLPAVWADNGQWLALCGAAAFASCAVYVSRRRWAEAAPGMVVS